MRTHLARCRKAYMAAAIAVCSFLIPVVDDGLIASEAIGTALAGLVAWQAVYWIPNRPNREPREVVDRITGLAG